MNRRSFLSTIAVVPLAGMVPLQPLTMAPVVSSPVALSAADGFGGVIISIQRLIDQLESIGPLDEPT